MSSIGQIELNSAMTRIQDYAGNKAGEELKNTVQQGQMQEQFHQEVDNQMTHVVRSSESEYQNKKFDAREKGNGEYTGDGGKRRKKEEKKDGRVVPLHSGGFDVKI
jgi:hypothetical protein